MILFSDFECFLTAVYYADIPVGAICCRIDNMSSTSAEKPPTLHILTLAWVSFDDHYQKYKGRTHRRVLAPYRSLSLGRALVVSALKNALYPTTPPPPVPSTTKANTRSSLTVAARKSVKRAVAYVQVGNDDAKRFYEALGFKESEVCVGLLCEIEHVDIDADFRVKDYYSKIEPRDAVLMTLEDIASVVGEKTNGAA